MKQMKYLTIAVVLLAVSALGQQPDPPSADPLPDYLKISRIESITAEVRDADTNRSVSFVVSRSCWQEIIDSLQPAKRDSERASGKVLGSLKIRYSDLPIRLEIELFDVPEAPGGFAIQENGGHLRFYRGGDSAKLKAAILKARKSDQ